MTNATCPIESGEPDEPLVIQAADSRVAAAIAMWIFSLIWNGVIGLVFLFANIGPGFFPMLFSTVFGLIGIAILVFAIYCTMQIFNPRPILICSQRDIYPGSEFELSWVFRGNSKKIQSMSIVLEGIESVTYRQGTSTRTETVIFLEKKVMESSVCTTIQQGFELISLPVTTMHSFKSSNNAFTWQIRVFGKIALWPDINDRFEIIVLTPKSVT